MYPAVIRMLETLELRASAALIVRISSLILTAERRPPARKEIPYFGPKTSPVPTLPAATSHAPIRKLRRSNAAELITFAPLIQDQNLHNFIKPGCRAE